MKSVSHQVPTAYSLWPPPKAAATRGLRERRRAMKGSELERAFHKSITLLDECHIALTQFVEALQVELPTNHERTFKKRRMLNTIERKLTSVTSHVNSAANTLIPFVHRLPAELLVSIFTLVRRDYMSTPLFNHSDLAHWGFNMNPMLVCRRWRHLIVSTPTLWSDIYDCDRAQMAMSLRRSQSTPIYLRIIKTTEHSFELEDQDLKKHVVPNLHRTSSMTLTLNIDRSSMEIPAWFHEYFGQSAYTPLMKMCFLQVCYYNYGDNESTHNLTTVLPTFLSGRTESINILTLTHFTSWPNNRFVNLQRLTLYNQSTQRVSLLEFLKFLSESPQLEELALLNGGPDISLMETSPSFGTFSIPDVEPVSLPRLRCLDISDWDCVGAVGILIQHLRFPASAVVSTWNISNSLAHSDGVALLLPMEDFDANLGKIRRREDKFTALRLLDSSPAPDFFLSTSDSLNLNGPSPFRKTLLPILQAGVLGLLERLYLQNLNRWYAVDETPLSEDEWRNVFTSLPKLRHLVTDSSHNLQIVRALSHRNCAPNLTHIRLLFDTLHRYIPIHAPLCMLVTHRACLEKKLDTVHVSAKFDEWDNEATHVKEELERLKTLGLVATISLMENIKKGDIPPQLMMPPEWPTRAYRWLNLMD